MQILSDIAISADGARIAVRGQQNGNDDIWVYDVGSEARTRVTDQAAAERHPAWTPAGRLAYSSYRGGAADVLVRIADGAPRALVNGQPAAALPRFSPDGRHVAYMANESGRWEVYVKAFPRGGVVQVSRNGGAWPRWSRAGDELFYFSGDELVAVPVSTFRGTLQFGPPVTLFTAGRVAMTQASLGTLDPVYDVAPDGQRFIVVQQLAGATP